MRECERVGRPRRASVAMGWLLVTAQLGHGGAAAPVIRPPLMADAGPGQMRLAAEPGNGALGIRIPSGATLPQREAIVFAQAAEATSRDVSAMPAEPAAAGADGGEAKPKFRWTVAPIRWGGTLANEFRQHQSADQARRRQLIDIIQLRGTTYLWQPWFAQVSGGVGLITTKERSAADPGMHAGDNSRSTAATGNGTLSVFPNSRFPFQALVDLSDSRANSDLTRSDFTSMRVGLRQTYQSPQGDANYNGSFDRNTLRSASFGRDTVDVYAAGMARTYGDHAYDVTGNHTRNTRTRNGEGSLLNRLTGRHSYRPESTFAVESLGSVSASAFRLRNSNDTISETSTRFVQLNTFATWRPEEGHPLFVTGGGRIFESTIDNNGSSSESRSLNAYMAANYAASRNLTVAGSTAVTHAASQTGDALITNQAGTVTYLPDIRRFGEYIYMQNATATVANQTGVEQGSRQNLGGQLGHNMSRVYPVGEAASISVNVGQSLGSNYDTVTATSQTLAHNAAISWRASPSPATSTYLGLMGADSRTWGHNENRFQLLNAQASGQIQIGRYSFTGANLTAQGTRQQTAATPDAPLNWNTNGNFNYQHARVFNVAGLRYYALYSVNETQYRSRLLGDINAPRDRVSQSFEQRLLYNIGRVEVRLTARYARIEGERNSLIFLRVSRQIGNF